MGQQERAGAECALRLAGSDASLADQRGLLVAGHSHDRDAVGEEIEARGLAEFPGAWAYFRQYLRRDSE